MLNTKEKPRVGTQRERKRHLSIPINKCTKSQRRAREEGKKELQNSWKKIYKIAILSPYVSIIFL